MAIGVRPPGSRRGACGRESISSIVDAKTHDGWLSVASESIEHSHHDIKPFDYQCEFCWLGAHPRYDRNRVPREMDAVGRNRALPGPADCGQDRRTEELVGAQPQISCRFDRSPSSCNVDISPRKRSYRPAGLCWTQRSQILTGSGKVYPRFQSADILHVIPHATLDMVHAVCGDFSGSLSSSESPRPTVFGGMLTGTTSSSHRIHYDISETCNRSILHSIHPFGLRSSLVVALLFDADGRCQTTRACKPRNGEIG